MKVVIKEAFHDKFHFSHVFFVGEVVDFEEKRANDLIARGLVEKVADVPGGQEGDKPPKKEEEKIIDAGTKEEEQPKVKVEEVNVKDSEADAKKASEKAAAEKIAKAKAKLKK